LTVLALDHAFDNELKELEFILGHSLLRLKSIQQHGTIEWQACQRRQRRRSSYRRDELSNSRGVLLAGPAIFQFEPSHVSPARRTPRGELIDFHRSAHHELPFDEAPHRLVGR